MLRSNRINFDLTVKHINIYLLRISAFQVKYIDYLHNQGQNYK